MQIRFKVNRVYHDYGFQKTYKQDLHIRLLNEYQLSNLVSISNVCFFVARVFISIEMTVLRVCMPVECAPRMLQLSGSSCQLCCFYQIAVIVVSFRQLFLIHQTSNRNYTGYHCLMYSAYYATIRLRYPNNRNPGNKVCKDDVMFSVAVP